MIYANQLFHIRTITELIVLEGPNLVKSSQWKKILPPDILRQTWPQITFAKEVVARELVGLPSSPIVCLFSLSATNRNITFSSVFLELRMTSVQKVKGVDTSLMVDRSWHALCCSQQPKWPLRLQCMHTNCYMWTVNYERNLTYLPLSQARFHGRKKKQQLPKHLFNMCDRPTFKDQLPLGWKIPPRRHLGTIKQNACMIVPKRPEPHRISNVHSHLCSKPRLFGSHIVTQHLGGFSMQSERTLFVSTHSNWIDSKSFDGFIKTKVDKARCLNMNTSFWQRFPTVKREKSSLCTILNECALKHAAE